MCWILNEIMEILIFLGMRKSSVVIKENVFLFRGMYTGAF